MSLRVWVIGKPIGSEFVAALWWLGRHCDLTMLPDGERSEVLRAQNSVPDYIVLLQRYPGEWKQRMVDELRSYWPAVRILALLGSWCEGEARTGRPLAGVERVYWYDFECRLAPVLASSADRIGPAMPPRGSGDSERFQLEVARIPGSRRGLVVIAAPYRESFESLSDACTDLGYATMWQRSDEWAGVRGAVAGIWDASIHAGETEWNQLALFIRRLQPHPVIVTWTFPRSTEARRIREMGGQLLAKPFLLADLAARLRRTLSPVNKVESTSSNVPVNHAARSSR